MFFSRLRDWAARVCDRPSARPVLYALSFSESIFFPIPVDVALAPVVARQPQRWVSIALWCTVYSVAGALVAYLLAMMFWASAVAPWLSEAAREQTQIISAQLRAEGFVLVLISAFTPIPFKLCALSAGAVAMSLPVFIGASLLGRTARYGLVAYLVVRFREHWGVALNKYAEPAGLTLLAAFVVYLVYLYV